MNTRSSKKIISVVDDDLDIVCLFFDALRAVSGVKKYKFTDGALAFEHFKVNRDSYSVIICDNRMPGISGLELLSSVKKMNPFVRTILITAFDIDDVMFKHKGNPKIIDCLIQKPVKIHQFVEEVRKQLRLYESMNLENPLPNSPFLLNSS